MSNKLSIRNCRSLKFIFITILLLSFLKVILSNALATNGTIISRINEKIATTNGENQKLKEEIAQLGSLKRISQEAIKSGFVSNGTVVSVSMEIPIALR